MWLRKIAESSSILLVGECNFSFTCSLLNYIDNPSIITSTCFETDPDIEPRKKNIEILREKGVRVLLGVDATKLSENEELSKEFDYIIFNFPHVGGKSRNHLNRDLLSGFFISASTCLVASHKSRVLVSLCRGQGGVIIDSPRRFRAPGDTWKVVEMAAHGGFILNKVEPFQADQFQFYNPSGYGKEGNRGFNTEGSLTYIFCKSQTPRSGLPLTSDPFFSDSLRELLLPKVIQTAFGSLLCSNLHAKQYLDNILNNEPIVCILEYLIKRINPQCVINADEKVPLHVAHSILQISGNLCGKNEFHCNGDVKKMPPKCSIDGVTFYLRDSLIYSLYDLLITEGFVFITGHIFKDFGSDFTVPLVGAEAMLCGEGATTLILDILTELIGGPGQWLLRMPIEDIHTGFSSLNPYYDTLCYEIVSVEKMLILGCVFHNVCGTQEICTLNLDNIAVIVYNSNDWRELRPKGCRVSFGNNLPKSSLNIDQETALVKQLKNCKIAQAFKNVRLMPISLYPPSFVFDVCLSFENNIFDRELWKLLWHIVGDVITNVELLNVYYPPPEKVNHRQSWCYRLTYCSYEWPLHRKSVVRISNEVVNWSLENILGAHVN